MTGEEILSILEQVKKVYFSDQVAIMFMLSKDQTKIKFIDFIDKICKIVYRSVMYNDNHRATKYLLILFVVLKNSIDKSQINSLSADINKQISL